MYSAPAVTVRCTGGPLWRALLCCLPALATAALVYWALLHADLQPFWALMVALGCGAASAVAAARYLPSPVQLCWDGAVWTCGNRPVRPQVMVDTGASWLLLRLRPITGLDLEPLVSRPVPAWLAVSQRDAAAAWHAFRAAVYCAPLEPSPHSSARQPP